MLVSISDTGHVCDIQVLKSLNEDLDKQAIKAIRGQLFQAIQQDGKPVPGSMTVLRDFWNGDQSNIQFSQNRNATPDEISAVARAFPALDIPSLIALGKITDDRYENSYFGLSITAPEAELTSGTSTDGQGRNARLVEVVAHAKAREEMYAISVLADRLSNYPQLKSRAEYVQGMGAQLRQAGAKALRDEFPYAISNVGFEGVTLREADGPGSSHVRGLFTAVMKGYVLTIDIAAPTEVKVLKVASAIQFKDDK
jgi:hypothetical protein